MSKKFTDLQGKATKSGPDRMKFVEGRNRFRIVSPVVPAYKYWLKTKDGTSVPMECLGFDREKEKFTNIKKDWVRHYFPEMKCSWAYSSFVIDGTDGKVKLLDFKKKLFEQILHAAKSKLGDPSDPDNGWWIVCTRTKTGPKVFNVEYTLEVFELEKTPLSDTEKALLENLPDIEEVLRQQTPEEQREFIENNILADEEEKEEEEQEFNGADDDLDDEIPF